MKFKVTATFHGPAEGNTREYEHDTYEEAMDNVEAAMLADEIMKQIAPDWNTEYLIEEVPDNLSDMVFKVITKTGYRSAGGTEVKWFRTREEAEEYVAKAELADKIMQASISPEWRAEYEIVEPENVEFVA